MSKKNKLSLLPAVNDLLKQPAIEHLVTLYGKERVTDSCRQLISDIRSNFLNGDEQIVSDDRDKNLVEVIEAVTRDIIQKSKPSLKKVINATGTILHTNLGRSNLSDKVINHLTTIATGYSNLEYNIGKGQRGSRYDNVTSLIKELTGAEDALIVNNNAAAVLLTLNTMTKDQDVIVSRGELVEIGGSFRIPSVIEASGCHLKEVGTTNKTHLYDYEQSISDNTGAILKVHTSNFKVIGFTDSVSSQSLSQFAQKADIPYIEDLGSGLLIDLSPYGFHYEPTVKEVITNGADIVTFSGDKILGGPQAGIIVGKKKYIGAMKKNQLTRVLRVDKMVLAALEGTLSLYRDEQKALKDIPTLQMLTMDLNAINTRANDYIKKLNNLSSDFTFNIKADFSQVGGGSYPGHLIPTKVITVTSKKRSINWLETRLRENDVPIIVRIKDNELLLDVRTVPEADFEFILSAFTVLDHLN